MAKLIRCDNATCPSQVTVDEVPLAQVEGYHTSPEGLTWRKKARLEDQGSLSHWFTRAGILKGDPLTFHAHDEACADAIDAVTGG